MLSAYLYYKYVYVYIHLSKYVRTGSHLTDLLFVPIFILAVVLPLYSLTIKYINCVQFMQTTIIDAFHTNKQKPLISFSCMLYENICIRIEVGLPALGARHAFRIGNNKNNNNKNVFNRWEM